MPPMSPPVPVLKALSISLEDHVVEVWITDRWLDHPGINAIGEILTTAAFTERVTHFGGYDLSHCGERVAAA